MAYPEKPTIDYSYTGHAQAQGDASFPGSQLDNDLFNLQTSVSALNQFVRGVTRSDGKLGNRTVGREQLATDITLGFNPPASWETGTAYVVPDTVFFGGAFYACTIAHTASADFQDDLDAGRWEVLVDFLDEYYSKVEADALFAVETEVAATFASQASLDTLFSGGDYTTGQLLQTAGGTGATSLGAASVTPTGRSAGTLASYLATALDGQGVPGAAGGAADDETAINAAIATGRVVLDAAYNMGGQFSVIDNLEVEWRQGAVLKQTGFSDTGSFITNSRGSQSAESIVAGNRFYNPQIDMSDYPAPAKTTAGTGSTTTQIVLASGASAVDDFYNGLCLEVMTGDGAGHGIRFITDYVGSTRTATIHTAIGAAPSNGDVIWIGWNDNPFGFASGYSDVEIWGGKLQQGGEYVPSITGGKGVNFEQGVHDALVAGTSVYDAQGAAFFVQGKDGTAANGQALKTTGIRLGLLHAEDSGAALMIAGINSAQAPDGDGADQQVVVSGLTFERCGHAPDRIVSSDPEKGGIIVLAEAQNVVINSVKGFNPGTYPSTAPGYPSGAENAKRVGFGLTGPVGALILGHGRNITISDVVYDGACDAAVRLARARAYGDDAGPDGKPLSCFNWRLRNIQVNGVVTEILGLDDDSALHPAADQWTGEIEVVVNTATRLVAPELASFSGVTLTAIEYSSRKTIIGTPADILARGNTFASYPSGVTDLRMRDRHVAVIDDDDVYRIVPIASFGTLEIDCTSSGSTGFVRFVSGASPAAEKISAGGSNLIATTGALVGTTGTDGRLTIGVGDGFIDIENRLGGPTTVRASYKVR